MTEKWQAYNNKHLVVGTGSVRIYTGVLWIWYISTKYDIILQNMIYFYKIALKKSHSRLKQTEETQIKWHYILSIVVLSHAYSVLVHKWGYLCAGGDSISYMRGHWASKPTGKNKIIKVALSALPT